MLREGGDAPVFRALCRGGCRLESTEGYVFSWFLESVKGYRKGITRNPVILYGNPERKDPLAICPIGTPVLSHLNWIGEKTACVVFQNGRKGYVDREGVSWLER